MTDTENLQEIAKLLDEAVAAGRLSYLKEMLFLTAIFTVAVMAVFFLLEAIGLYKINRRLGTRCAGLAFIPGFSGYALGAAADGLKKRKPSNYSVHMLMVKLFYTVAAVVYYVYVIGRVEWFFGALESGHPMDTFSLLRLVESYKGADRLFLISYYVVYFVGYAVTFVSLLCYARILQLFRTRGALFFLIASVTVPQVMSVYLFVMRNKELHTKPPVFRFPGMEEMSGGGAGSAPENPAPFTDDHEEDGDGDGDGDRDGDRDGDAESSEPSSENEPKDDE